MNESQVVLVGNATEAPELRFTPGGDAVTNFGIAVNFRRKAADGTWEDGEPSFFNCTAWRTLAENVAETVTKGMRLVIVGTLKMRYWQTEEGDKRSAVDVTVDSIGPELKWATATVTRNEKTGGASTAPFASAPATDDF